MTDKGFVKLRRGLAEHFSNGWISPSEFIVFTNMLMKADWETGEVHANATDFVTKGFSDRLARRAIAGLIKKKYIICPSGDRHGKRGKAVFSIRNYDGLSKEESMCPSDDRHVSVMCPSDDRHVSVSEQQVPNESMTYEPEELRSKNKEIRREEKELRKDEMKANKMQPLRAIFFRELNVLVPGYYREWDDIEVMVLAHGPRKVETMLTEWCQNNKKEQMSNPLKDFVSFVRGISIKDTDDKTKSAEQFCIGLSAMSNSEIVFNKFQRLEIQKLREEYGDEDLRSAFEQFYSSVQGDDFLLKNAPKQFVEVAGQLIGSMRLKRKETASTQALLEHVMATDTKPDFEPEPEIDPIDLDPSKW